MSKIRYLIISFVILNFAAALAAIIVAFVLQDQPWLIPISVVFIINGIGFFFVYGLNHRLEVLEAWLVKSTKSPKRKVTKKPPVLTANYSIGQSVVLKNFFTVDEHTFRKNACGKITKIVGPRTYLILFDEDPTKPYLVPESQLKDLSEL